MTATLRELCVGVREVASSAVFLESCSRSRSVRLSCRNESGLLRNMSRDTAGYVIQRKQLEQSEDTRPLNLETERKGVYGAVLTSFESAKIIH